MADLLRDNPNLFNEIFAELEDWEAILQALPDLEEEEPSSAFNPPDISPL